MTGKATYSITFNKFQHKLSDENQEQATLSGGQQIWRPALPEPLWVGWRLRKAKCDCGQVFKSKQAYIEHYIYWAIWQNESNYIPELLAKTQKAGENLNELKHAEKKEAKK